MARPVPWRWWWLIVAVLVVAMLIPRVRNWSGRAVTWSARPFSLAGQWLNSVAGMPAASSNDHDQLTQQLRETQEQLHVAQEQLSLAENVAALSAYGQTTRHHIVTASVITVSPDPGIQSIVINRGSDDGIKSGQAVVTEHGFFVGKVVIAHQTTSSVILLTDGQSVISGRVQNNAHSPGVIRGERGLAVNMSLIPKNDTLENGQTVITSGSEQGIPPDILIGTISSIHHRDGDLFQDVVVTPATDVQNVQVVGVITG